MIDLSDTTPAVKIAPAEYQRLLGYPRDKALEGRAAELAEWAGAWYATNGRPWVYTRQAEDVAYAGDKICIDGTEFTGKRLRRMLEQAEAHGAILMACGAGQEIEQEAQRLWQEEKPDEYFFLEVLGSAVVEHLTTNTGARLCAWAEEQQMAVLPHDSPGYPDWDISEQSRLLHLIRQKGETPLLASLEVLDSGALRPKKSLLAVFGLTHHTSRLQRLTDLVPCRTCSFSPCQYRRAPYQRDIASYTVNPRALRKWAAERLSLERHEDGSVNALFRYEGTTCTNMGRPLTFHYLVKLGPQREGYPIREQACVPAPGDTGHTFMCSYIDGSTQVMAAIGREKPLLGRRLDEVMSWQRAAFGTGCYCEPASREHKWGLVLETIHYALSQSDRS